MKILWSGVECTNMKKSSVLSVLIEAVEPKIINERIIEVVDLIWTWVLKGTEPECTLVSYTWSSWLTFYPARQ